MPEEVGRKERRNKMSEQAAHIANIILFVIVGVGFGIALLSVISVIVRVRRGKLKFVPADQRLTDINPATGLLMLNDVYDIKGNPYGCNHHDN
jgi:hypothetical protein